MTNNSPWQGTDSEISLTIKHDGGYEAPWTVFRGNIPQLRADLIAYAGLPEDSFEGKALMDVFLEVEKMAKAQYKVSDTLGGKVIPIKRGGKQKPRAVAEPAVEEDGNPILTAIQTVNTVEDLKRLWAENQSAFGDEEMMNAYKARGKELSSK